ncbi:MAG: UDP-N-acetylmuramate dehydrogenase [Clostridia bacterium]|nr:UDP-N-acetylmuramate dehydrogenase [Clostridia bacterium]
MIKIFEDILGKENVKVNEPMSRHTTFKIGGPADIFLTPETEEQTAEALKAAKARNIPVFVLGNGSNMLVGDKGIRGVVLSLFKRLNKIEVAGEEIYAGAGVLLSAVSSEAAKASLEGLEFASGIPGTIGGAVYMNAGAYGFEIKEIIKSVRYMDRNGNIFEADRDACEFGYRKSRFTDTDLIILGCTLKLKHGNEAQIRERIADYTQRRVSKQPIDRPSAGSTFKRPEGNFAGTLIEKAGLKGTRVGGAEVSEKHAGFLINTGAATADDVLELIKLVQDTVYKKDGIMLEPEVKLVGEF